MAIICVDACFLIGLYDKDDQHHAIAVNQFESMFGESSKRHVMIAPWPVLYECLGTRYVRDSRKSSIFNQRWSFLLESDQLQLLDDSSFRDIAVDEHLTSQSRNISLVDRVLRAMITDSRRFFDYFVTYNTDDFSDACREGSIVLVNEDTLLDTYDL
jgi:predicted nucleic acid-binding protein